MSVFMCFLILISGILVIMGSIRSNQVAAANEITFYFDSSCLGKNSDWVDKNPEYVYYYAYKSTNNTGIKRMEPVSGKTGSDGGKLYKGTVDKDQYSYLIILKNNNWSDKKYQTLDYSLNNVKDKDILILNTSGYNVGTNEYVQGMYVKGTFEETTNYSSQKFSILNMDDQEVKLKIRYSTNTKKYENGQWGDWNTDNNDYSEPINVTISARQYQYKQFEVPPRTGGEPWQSVHIYNSDGTKEIKKYYFPEGKILGRSFFYGVTDFQSTNPAPMDYGDGTKLCYVTSDLGSLGSTNYPIYFDKNFFTSAPEYGKISTPSGGYSTASELTKNGNAKYVTGENVPLSEWARGNTATNIDLSSQIMSVEYDGVQYNLFAPQNEGDNLVTVNDNVAVISGKYTVQSTGNDLGGQNYLTVKADFFDYQYDKFNPAIDDETPQYNYKEYNNNDGSYTNKTEKSKLGNAKRPYLAINEAISASDYGTNASNVPMYLGQFWLPLEGDYGTSTKAYDDNTAPNQRAGNNSYFGFNQRYWINGEQDYGYYTHFGFGNKLNNFKWGANLAFRTNDQQSGTHRPFDAVAQGLVNDYLDGSTSSVYAPNGKLKSKSGNTTVPYFDKSWWEGSYDTSLGSIKKADYLNYYSNLDFPFFEIQSNQITFQNGYTNSSLLSDTTDHYAGTYYVFDSKEYSIKVEGTPNNCTLKKSNKKHLNSNDESEMVYDNYGSDGAANNTTGQDLGLFPFNSSDEGGFNSDKLHYGYGIRYDIDFFLTDTGTIDGTQNGTPITFTFQGDDDVWVFLDGRLVLDMGGAHKNALGEINFKTKQTWISAIGFANTNSIISDNATNGNADDSAISRNRSSVTKSFSDWGNRISQGRHTITMFYMERGMLNSNLYVMFNLPLELTKYDLQTDTDFTGINTGFTAATKKVAENDVFNYQIQNRGTTKVVGSEYKYPTPTVQTRNNNETGTSTALSPPDGVTMIPQKVIDSEHLYLDTSSFTKWENDSAEFAVYYVNNTNKTAKLVPMEDVEDHIFRVDKDPDYNEVLIFRLPPPLPGKSYSTQYYPQPSGSERWNALKSYLRGINGLSIDKNGYWNSTGDATSYDLTDKNKITITDWDNSISWGIYQIDTMVSNTTPHTYDFKGSSGSYQPMISLVENVEHGVTYQLTEPNFGGGGVTTFDTRSVTTAKGVVSMQYGEMATFSKQLEGGSQMKVKLLDTLSAPVSGSRANSYKDSTGRKASDYYVTHYKQDELATADKYRKYAGIYRGDDVAAIALKHVDLMYSTGSPAPNNYSTNHVINPQVEDGALEFVFADPKNAADGYVYLRQVVVNEVRTVKLRISKDILADETCGDTFNFKIVFSNIFGANTGDSNIVYNQIAYKKYNSSAPDTPIETTTLGDDGGNNDGSFSLKKGQYIEIENIPVMTNYYLTETPDSQDFTLSDEYSVNMGNSTNKVVMNGNMSAVVTNKRTTGTIQVQKLVYDENGALMNVDGSLTTEFTLMIGLKAPGGVDLDNYLDNYPIKFMQNGTDLVATGKAVKLTADELTSYTSYYPTAENWAVYKVTVKANTAADGALRLNIQNVPYKTVYKVHELSVPLGFKIPTKTTKPTNSVWNQSAYNCNTSGTYANVMYKDNTKTLNNTDNDLVTVENNLNPIEMPSTGGSGVVLIFPLGILAIVLSGAAVMIYKRKIDNGSILRKGRYMK